MVPAHRSLSLANRLSILARQSTKPLCLKAPFSLESNLNPHHPTSQEDYFLVLKQVLLALVAATMVLDLF
jgi:hypothetical protein